MQRSTTYKVQNVLDPTILIMSFILILKRMTESILPWGTPSSCLGKFDSVSYLDSAISTSQKVGDEDG